MEIGSIFEIDPAVVSRHPKTIPQEEHLLELQLKEVQKYQKSQVQYTASGREALALALRSMEKNNADIAKRCLVPAYMCDCVFLTFLREGWDICFYHVNTQLRADPEELLALTAAYKPGVIFVHAYYGTDTWDLARHLLQDWQTQGILILEDVTQSYYLDLTRWDADYVIGSLRKWYPIPDGGFVAATQDLIKEEICQETVFAEKKLEIQMQKWNYLHGEDVLASSKSVFLQKNRELEADMDSGSKICVLSEWATEILTHMQEAQCKKRRAANYEILKHTIKWTRQVRPVLDKSSAYSCTQMPLYFAVYVQDRDRLQKYLAEHGIYAPVLWPVGKENRKKLHTEEEFIYRHLLALPIDQRYGEKEMYYISETINTMQMHG